MRSPASRSSVLSGFADALDVSDDMTVAKVLPRLEPLGVRQLGHGISTDEDHAKGAWRRRFLRAR
jgi:hypothetical protein